MEVGDLGRPEDKCRMLVSKKSSSAHYGRLPVDINVHVYGLIS